MADSHLIEEYRVCWETVLTLVEAAYYFERDGGSIREILTIEEYYGVTWE